ncbi:MAG: hypothetical protein IPP41_13360 [Rhodocyclaceae bacterium]|nr:hypothetical protein [Rhodocyclaceae bacterium]
MVSALFQYRSVFAQYQGYSEQPLTAWSDTNDVVQKIGGWRVYAREARLPDAVEKASATPSKTEMHGEHERKP